MPCKKQPRCTLCKKETFNAHNFSYIYIYIYIYIIFYNYCYARSAVDLGSGGLSAIGAHISVGLQAIQESIACQHSENEGGQHTHTHACICLACLKLQMRRLACSVLRLLFKYSSLKKCGKHLPTIGQNVIS